jgi:hypothetical protein
MSEIRRTTTIEEIEVPPREPLISLSQVRAAGGWMAFQTLKLAATTAVVGTKIAVQGGIAVTNAIKEHRRHASFSGIDEITKNSASAREAVTSLAAFSTLEVPSKEVSALNARLQALVATNDRAGIAVAAKQLLAARQGRLQAQLVPLVAASLKAIGFTPAGVVAAGGLVAAHREGTRQSLSIDVAKAKDGGLQLHLDADGFEGGACIVALDALQTELRSRGVHCDLQERRRKQSRPLVDRGRIGHRIHVRSSN